jgi:serine/threonine protein kinase
VLVDPVTMKVRLIDFGLSIDTNNKIKLMEYLKDMSVVDDIHPFFYNLLAAKTPAESLKHLDEFNRIHREDEKLFREKLNWVPKNVPVADLTYLENMYFIFSKDMEAYIKKTVIPNLEKVDVYSTGKMLEDLLGYIINYIKPEEKEKTKVLANLLQHCIHIDVDLQYSVEQALEYIEKYDYMFKTFQIGRTIPKKSKKTTVKRN